MARIATIGSGRNSDTINNMIKNQQTLLGEFESKYSQNDLDKEIANVAQILNNRIFGSYQEFEDEVSNQLKSCEVCTKFLNSIIICRTIMLGQIRNRIRDLANIKFKE